MEYGGEGVDMPAMIAQAERVAWRIRLEDFDWAVVYATTAAKAKWIAVKGWREAGFGHAGQWPIGLTVRRATKYDNHPNRNRPSAAYNETLMIIGGGHAE